jgi:hypothetical protein
MDCKNLLQRNGLFLMIQFMGKLGAATIALAIAFIVNVSVTAAYADEHISSSQTVLTSTTISGDDAFSSASSDSSDSFFLTDSSTFAPATQSESFSPLIIPEPSTIGLFTAGVLTLAVFVRSKRRSFHANQQTGVP